MINSIKRKLSHYKTIGTKIRDEQETYQGDSLCMVESMNDEETLCRIYTTYIKYIPKASGEHKCLQNKYSKAKRNIL